MPLIVPEPLMCGKVRDIYTTLNPATLLMVATNRLSVFDRVVGEVPNKGWYLSQLAEYWFTRTAIADMPNHFLSTDLRRMPGWATQFSGRIMLVRRARIVPFECIVRGYLAGSAWREYRSLGTVHGELMQDGLVEMDRLPEPIFTPSTKAGIGLHDKNIPFEELVSVVGWSQAEEMRRLSLEIYRIGAEHARERGIIIADTKVELGWCDGELIVCDEVLTPDSSRFVDESDYNAGRRTVWMDKEPVREYVRSIGWDQQGPLSLPPGVIAETDGRYRNVYRRLIAPI